MLFFLTRTGARCLSDMTSKGNPKLNFFEPKKLAESDGNSLMELRYSMFGAVYLTLDGGLKHVPKTARATTLWEVL